MNSVAGDALENQRRSLLSEARTVQNLVESQKVTSREEVEKLRYELSQSPTLYNTSRAAPESSSEIQPLRRERDSLITCCRSRETEIGRLRGSRFFGRGEIPRLRGMLEVERRKPNTLQAGVLRLTDEN